MILLEPAMPNLYHCSSCYLGFETGPLPTFDDSEQFRSESRLVCRKCGTVHAVRHAHFAASDVLSGQPGPITVPAGPDTLAQYLNANREKIAFLFNLDEKDVGQIDYRNGLVFHELLMESYQKWSDSELRSTTPDGPVVMGMRLGARLNLANAQCSCCRLKGTLVEWSDADLSCPRCGNPTVCKIGEYDYDYD